MTRRSMDDVVGPGAHLERAALFSFSCSADPSPDDARPRETVPVGETAAGFVALTAERLEVEAGRPLAKGT